MLRPIGRSGSKIRAETEKVRKEIIEPALQIQGTSFRVEVIETTKAAGCVSDETIETVYSAYLCIADLTYMTPNTMFEIGYRLALNLPAIVVVHEDEFNKLPFDVKNLDIITYSLSTKKARTSAIRRIRNQVRIMLRGEEKNTIFYRTLKDVGERWSWRSIYISFEESLKHTLNSIRAHRLELRLEKEFNITTLKEHLRLLQEVFRRLSDKLHVFTQIATGASQEYTDSRLLQLTALAGEALEKGDIIHRRMSDVIKQVGPREGRGKRQVIEACYLECGRVLAITENVLEKALADTQKQFQPSKHTEHDVDFSKVLEFLETHGYRLRHFWGSYRVFTRGSELPFLVPVRDRKVSEDYFRLLREQVKDAN